MKKIILILTISILGCAKPCKTVGNMQCKKNIIQICNSKKQWQKWRDCSGFKGTLCGKLNNNVTCIVQKDTK